MNKEVRKDLKMASKDQANDSSSMLTPNINIDITDTSGQMPVKSMNIDSSRVGLSKEELLKYADQPFWVRLRNILFATFWIVWLSILAAAIGYVIQTPGCGSTNSLNSNMTSQATTSSV